MPIEFHCTGCNKLLRVPDDAAGRKAQCPGCEAILEIPAATTADPTGAADSQAPSAPPDSDNPFQSPTTSSAAAYGYSASVERSGWVTTVGIVNLVFGSIQLLCGGCMSFGGLMFIGPMREAIQKEMDGGPGPEVADFVGVFMVVMIVVLLASGALLIAAGVGVLKRRPWGRILTFVLGGLTGVGTLFNMASMDPGSIIPIGLGIAYCALVFGVLCKSRYAAEFR